MVCTRISPPAGGCDSVTVGSAGWLAQASTRQQGTAPVRYLFSCAVRLWLMCFACQQCNQVRVHKQFLPANIQFAQNFECAQFFEISGSRLPPNLHHRCHVVDAAIRALKDQLHQLVAVQARIFTPQVFGGQPDLLLQCLDFLVRQRDVSRTPSSMYSSQRSHARSRVTAKSEA